MLLMIDNFDSFTYNIVQALAAMGAEVAVRRNDAVGLDEIAALQPDGIIISPGPGTPQSAGISMDVVRRFHATTPIFGVCLGHQCIGAAFGARIVHARRVMHGKRAAIAHDGTGLFAGLPQDFHAVRYHSLVVDRAAFPAMLTACAFSDDGEIMGLVHKHYPLYGVQFHPESIGTEYGREVMRAFLSMTKGER